MCDESVVTKVYLYSLNIYVKMNMNSKIKAYDVIVVYSESIAHSARDKHYREDTPILIYRRGARENA